MMVRLAILLLSLPLLAAGSESLYHVLTNRQLVTMTCEQFVRTRPRAAWLRLTNCEVDYLGAGFTESGAGRITELFFPVRPDGEPRTAPAILVLATDDETALATAQQTIGEGRQPNQEQFLVMMLTIVTQLRASREIQGFARKTLFDVLRTRRALSGLASPIDPDFVALDLYEQPSPVFPAILTGAGAVGLFTSMFLLVRGRRRRVEPPPEEETVGDILEADAPAAPASRRRLLPLMLLNIPAGAGAEAVEDAPPLGSRAEVLARLGTTMPGLRADERGRCVYSRAGHSITIDLGAGELVPTVIIQAEGDRAVAAVEAILAGTGWRAFAPRLGRFVDIGKMDDVVAPETRG